LRHQLRFGALFLTRAQVARRRLAERREIVTELEDAKRDYSFGLERATPAPDAKRYADKEQSA
jgi:hypothetical protein